MRATQFFEFTKAIADASMIDGKLHLAPVHYQPIASDDVASAVSRAAIGAPLNGTTEIGGPERVRMDQFIPAALARSGDERDVVVDEHATYFGTELADDSLVPGAGAELGIDHLRGLGQGVRVTRHLGRPACLRVSPLSQTPAVVGHQYMTNIPNSPDLSAIAYEAQVEILVAETIQAAGPMPDDAALRVRHRRDRLLRGRAQEPA